MRRTNPTLPLFAATLVVALAGCNPPPPANVVDHTPPASPPLPTTAPAAPTPMTPAASPVATAGVPPFADPRHTIPFLASDDLAGRLPGTPGLARAGDVLAEDFQRLGLVPPPGRADDFQPFTMKLSTTLDPATGLLVNGRPLTVGTDFAPLSASGEGPFRGPVVFAGYSIAHGADYDDYAAVDASGKVVLAMMKEPLDTHNHSRFAGPGQTWSPAAYFNAKAAAARAHGAVGLLLVSPPTSGGPDDVRPFFADADPASAAPLPMVQVSRRVADLLLTTANRPDLKTLQVQIDADFRPHPVPLADVAVTGEVVVKRSAANVRNVLAALPGTGPHADEWVVVGAHYDHLGRGQMGHMIGPAGPIYHGADDNASGTAAVLELAAKLKASGPLPRSVLFCLFTAEEEGLIGSDYFVGHPAVPLDHVAAMLNLDMVGRLRHDDLQVGGAGTAKAFDAMVAAAVAGTGLHTSTALPDEDGRGGLGPSDHMSFARHQVPVLFLFTGMHADYHGPADTADKVNYDGIDRIVTVAGRLVTAMAAMPRPAYDDSSDSRSAVIATLGGSQPATSHGHAALGVVPDIAAGGDGSPGVPLSGVAPDGPAAAAGVKGGDRLVGLGPKPVNTLQDLTDALSAAQPGDAVDVRVVRDGQPVTLHATLSERKRGR